MLYYYVKLTAVNESGGLDFVWHLQVKEHQQQKTRTAEKLLLRKKVRERQETIEKRKEAQ